ncbi:MAG TPA: hypothetical protein VK582_16265 [Pyrinomonadaceae bacterium]|nr:hypothetical protein [Pyrinomonadaceae bacterium]
MTLGIVQAWVSRFAMNPDGISYLDIGDGFWRGDFQTLLNGYWSPLYGFLLGLALKILKPSPYWEFPVVHLVNFLIYLLALLSFDFFLREFIKARQQDRDEALPVYLWLTIGYLLFISSSLLMITLGVVSPDMLIAACIYLAAALLLRIRGNPQQKADYIFLGLVLGIGYVSKTVMFPLAFVILSVSFILAPGPQSFVFWLSRLVFHPLSFGEGRGEGLSPSSFAPSPNPSQREGKETTRQANRSSLLAVIVFLAIAAPLILALSLLKGRPTFGDSGKLNYVWEVNRIPKYIHWQGEPATSGVPKHPTRKIFDQPAAYEFATPLSGSYPPWFDPSYWHEGVRPTFNFRRQFAVFNRWSLTCAKGFVGLCGGLFTVVFLLLAINRRGWSPRKMASSSWFILLIAIVPMLMYSLVFVSLRYIAPFEVLLWLSLFSGLPGWPESRRRWDNVAVWLGFLFMFSVQTPMPMMETARSLLYRTPDPQPTQWQIANGLNQMGMQPGEKVASIGDALYAQWYRLARVQVVAEVPGGPDVIETFWKAEPAVREQVLERLAKAGARAVVIDSAPRDEKMDGWQRIADTDASVYFLRER